MKRIRPWNVAGILAGAQLVACSSAEPGRRDAMSDVFDATTPPADHATPDVPTPPESGPDAALDAGPDAPPAPPACAASAMIDLAGVAPDANGTVHYVGNNLAARMATFRPSSDGFPNAVYQVALHYRMRTDGVLRVSTYNPGTDLLFDTLLVVTSACTESDTVLACDDNGAIRWSLQSTAATAPLAAGSDVYLFVGGVLTNGTGYAAQGTFELTVRELTPLAEGDPCTGDDVCGDGLYCQPQPDRSDQATCKPRGLLGAPCRLTGAPCDGALQCSYASMPRYGVCQEVVAAGSACDTAWDVTYCDGGFCEHRTDDLWSGVCVAQRTEGGVCPYTLPPPDGNDNICLDDSLRCAFDPDLTMGYCRATVATAGAPCDPSDRVDACATGLNCAAAPADPLHGTCVADGAQGGACRTTAPACDPGLTCSAAHGGVCRATVPVGMPCDHWDVSTQCAAGSVCAVVGETSSRCVVPVPEIEPNDSAFAPQAAIRATTAFAASLARGEVADCFGVTMPAGGGTLLAETNTPTGRCPPYTEALLALYTRATPTRSPMLLLNGGLIAWFNGCSRLRAQLDAGDYTLCVQPIGGDGLSRGYNLDVAILPAL